MSQFKHYFSPDTPNKNKTAVLLVNLGTPNSTSVNDVKNYLHEFLADPRVVEMPRLIWLTILHGFILRFRPSKTAKAYKKIWLKNGSPLLVNSETLTKKLNSICDENHRAFLAMTYGKPSIKNVLKDISKQGFDSIKVIPLYPQYSATTSAPIFDLVAKNLIMWRRIPNLSFHNQYYAFDQYTNAIATTIKNYLKTNQPDLLLFSFHGIPVRNIKAGDPYQYQCEQSVQAIAKASALDKHQWKLVYQSRMGRDPWLSPYADKTIKKLAKQGIKKIAVISPGFAVDCLETLEETAMVNKQIFIKNGGEQFDYIPCLNSSDQHAHMLKDIFKL